MIVLVMVASQAVAETHDHESHEYNAALGWAVAVECSVMASAECGIFLGAALSGEWGEVHLGAGPLVLVHEEGSSFAFGAHADYVAPHAWKLRPHIFAGTHRSEDWAFELGGGAVYWLTDEWGVGVGIDLRLHEPAPRSTWHEVAVIPSARISHASAEHLTFFLDVGLTVASSADTYTGIVSVASSPAMRLGVEMHLE